MGINSDPLFLGLTRPAMLFGVSYMFAAFNGLGCMMYYILADSPFAILLLPFFHGIAYMICLQEPLAIELLMTKGAKCSKCKNKGKFGANSYDVY